MVEGTANTATGWRANHQRTGKIAVRPIADFRDFVDDLVERRIAVVDELHLGHRRETLERQALSDGRDTRLRQRHVHHALGAEALLQALGRFEDATFAADVLPEHADPIVTLHFFVERVAHGLDQRALRHRRTRAGPASPAPARVRPPPPRSPSRPPD